MSKLLFYIISIIASGVIFGLVLKITNLPDHFWAYFFAGGFIMGVFWEVFIFFYNRLFPGEKLFRLHKKG